ncbi:MAG: methyltransferase domain-containing protein [Deltaproteobacteria bacterium]|nr:methyltransferase domain-containing protein [Deltaproteobacteria bacterium]
MLGQSRRLAALALVAACSSSAPTQSTDKRAQDDRASYEGRPIAETCSYLGADWLDRADREAREQPERVLDLLAIQPGSTVADVGAGTGYFTVRLAKRVGATGEVIATELQPEMLRLLDHRVSRERITNVRLIRGTEQEAKLPERCCDLVLMVDVYHELSSPPAIMAGVRRALKPKGRLVLVEYKGEDPKIPIKPEHKMTLAQIKKELAPLGFAFVTSHETLPDQRVVIFTRDDAPP